MRKLLNRLTRRHMDFVASKSSKDFSSIRRSELYKNTKKHLKVWRRVALDVDKVQIAKTVDTNDHTIQLINSNGEKATLWLEGDIVRSITPY